MLTDIITVSEFQFLCNTNKVDQLFDQRNLQLKVVAHGYTNTKQLPFKAVRMER